MGKEDKKLNVGLRLLIANPGSADPVLPIGWCVEPKTLETIERQRIKNPHLLITVAKMLPNYEYPDGKDPDGEEIYDFRETDRWLVPLKQGLEYYELSQPGKYRLFATIVGDEYKTVKELRDHCGLRYGRSIVTRYGEFTPPKPNLRRASVTVDVGTEFFAHEPSEWEQNWVNLWFGYRAKDQCQFRKRRILAYTVQAVVMSLWWLIIALYRLCLAALLLIGGYRKINWSGIWHPWNTDYKYWVTRDVNFDNSVFFKSRSGTIRWFLIPAWPYTALTVTAIVWFFKRLYDGSYSWLWLLLLFAKTFLWIFAIGSLAFWVLNRIPVSKKMPEPEAEAEIVARQEAKKAAAIAAAMSKQQAQLQYLQCGLTPEVPGLKALPHVPIRLLFTALKAKVCRPFRYS